MLRSLSCFFVIFWVSSCHVSSHKMQDEPLLPTSDLFDTAALGRSIDLINKLSLGQTVPDESWNQLFDSKGFQVLEIATGKSRYSYQSMLEFHYSKAKSNERYLIREGKDVIKKAELSHFEYVIANRKACEGIIKNFVDERLYEEADQLARSFIPKGMLSRLNSKPTVFFLVIGQNAYANDLGVVADPFFFETLGREARVAVLAHELHHVYFDTLLPKEFSRSHPFTSLAYNIQKEGIADLIDKPNLLGRAGERTFGEELIKVYRDLFAQGPAVIENINSGYLQYQQDKVAFKPNWAELRPVGGHASGYYMALANRRAGLLNEWLLELSNPHAIFLYYDKARKKLNDPALAPIHPALLSFYAGAE